MPCKKAVSAVAGQCPWTCSYSSALLAESVLVTTTVPAASGPFVARRVSPITPLRAADDGAALCSSITAVPAKGKVRSQCAPCHPCSQPPHGPCRCDDPLCQRHICNELPRHRQSPFPICPWLGAGYPTCRAARRFSTFATTYPLAHTRTFPCPRTQPLRRAPSNLCGSESELQIGGDGQVVRRMPRRRQTGALVTGLAGTDHPQRPQHLDPRGPACAVAPFRH